jgi:CRISPR/Cas system-associated protein Cas10 (large subunit of type III CRISPR-Cas system)
MKEEIFEIECDACGNKGRIRNTYKENEEFDGCYWQGAVYLITVEGHSVPVCKKCNALMGSPKDED